MEDAVKLALRIVHILAGVMWAGAAAFAAYRFYQMSTLRAVEAEVLKAETGSFLETGEEEDADGFRRQYTHRVYRAQALVRYEYQGKKYTAMARQDTTTGFKSAHDRLVAKWRPGTRIRVHIDPRKPDQPRMEVGLNLNTFWMTIVLTAAGFICVGMGYGLRRVAAFFTRLMGE